ncbi:TIGR00730 family Rossman fold protein [Microvirga sp. W0021]|uniref:Cytokinin riboside 5'-monophosphate phosphoribohydrolase n=1 Tax=Hohaiivirga grylli TaxID=3133970 RepID=A0ABV0BHW9_9HYPH
MTDKTKDTGITNSAQMLSHSYELPSLDPEFILSDEMRGVRFLLEYSKAELTLRRWGIRSTVVVFGSARTHEDGHQKARHWYNEARSFGRIVSERGGALQSNGGVRDNVIATGGGPGVMEAANRGASEAGAPTIGFNITLPHEQEPNRYSTPDLTFRFHYFGMRKMHLAMRANALVVFPGGFGTFDELFEILTLCQTGKMPKVPIILFDREYWTKLINMEYLVEMGMIHAEDLTLFDYAESAEEAWEKLVAKGIPNPGKTS